MSVLMNKTKSELVEIIRGKENEILDLKEELRLLEKCEKYNDLTDECWSVYSKLIGKGFLEEQALRLVEVMISVGHIPAKSSSPRGFMSYR